MAKTKSTAAAKAKAKPKAKKESSKAVSKAQVREPVSEPKEQKRAAAAPKPPPVERRKLRYILFRCRLDEEWTMDRDLRELAPAIRSYFDYELDRRQLSWAGFTFEWDVSADDPFDIISPDIREWADKGGQFEGKPGELSDEAWVDLVVKNGIAARRRPPAFTHQG